MMVVIDRIVFTCRVLMTRSTKQVAFMLESIRMRVMTIGTANPVVVHLALNERTVNVVFITDLTINVVDRIHYDLGCKIVIKITARLESVTDHRTPRMTGRTRFNLRTITLGLQFRQTVPVIAIPKKTFSVGKLNVITTRSMTCFTADVDF